MVGGSWAEAGLADRWRYQRTAVSSARASGRPRQRTAAVPRGPANAENGVGVEGSRRYGTALVLGAHRAAELGIWWPLA